jgi:hypothetical protein
MGPYGRRIVNRYIVNRGTATILEQGTVVFPGVVWNLLNEVVWFKIHYEVTIRLLYCFLKKNSLLVTMVTERSMIQVAGLRWRIFFLCLSVLNLRYSTEIHSHYTYPSGVLEYADSPRSYECREFQRCLLPHHQGETSVNLCQTTRRNIPEESYPHTRRHENLKSLSLVLCL